MKLHNFYLEIAARGGNNDPPGLANGAAVCRSSPLSGPQRPCRPRLAGEASARPGPEPTDLSTGCAGVAVRLPVPTGTRGSPPRPPPHGVCVSRPFPGPSHRRPVPRTTLPSMPRDGGTASSPALHFPAGRRAGPALPGTTLPGRPRAAAPPSASRGGRARGTPGAVVPPWRARAAGRAGACPRGYIGSRRGRGLHSAAAAPLYGSVYAILSRRHSPLR